eukprot:SAG11_NODE_1725_length_4370_cov_13.867947_3_plen_182_part_00
MQWRRCFAIGDVQPIIVPGMGDSITEGEILAWQVSVGDHVNVDDVLVEIETDKVTTEVKAVFPGTITVLLAEQGDTVGVNQEIAKMEEGEATEAAAVSPALPAAVPETAPTGAPAAAAAPSTPAAPSSPVVEELPSIPAKGNRSEQRVRRRRPSRSVTAPSLNAIVRAQFGADSNDAGPKA